MNWTKAHFVEKDNMGQRCNEKVKESNKNQRKMVLWENVGIGSIRFRNSQECYATNILNFQLNLNQKGCEGFLQYYVVELLLAPVSFWGLEK